MKAAAGIRCPTPLLLRMHFLVEFIGKGGWAAMPQGCEFI